MNRRPLYKTASLFPIFLVLCAVSAAPARAGEEETGFVPLFNGKDFTGWVNVDCGPSTFFIRDGQIITTGIPEGYLRTDKHYENFILELDWMHVTHGGNSGLFVFADALPAVGAPWPRSFENQILDGRETANYTSDGDLFAIHGSSFKPDRPHPAGWMRCLPSEKRSHPAGEWNHYRIECNDGTIKLGVNGKIVSGGTDAKPRKGYICLESEEGECRFKNIRIKELPTSHPKPEDVATVDEGFKCIYTGDLSGWEIDPSLKEHWKPKRWILTCDGKAEGEHHAIRTEKEYPECILMMDWRRPPATEKGRKLTASPSTTGPSADGSTASEPMDECIIRRGPKGIFLKVGPESPAKHPGEWNRFIITMRKATISVELNGQVISRDAPVATAVTNGKIELSYRGQPMEFANFFVKPLEEKP